MNLELARTLELASADENGLKDVSVMSKGPARGHGMRIDDKTLNQAMTMLLGQSYSAYLTHKGATDDEGVPQDRLGQEMGVFSGFYREGDQIKARNFTFLDSWKKANPELHSKIVELAKNFPEQLGISPVVKYIKAWITKDGERPDTGDGGVPANLAEDTPAMRIRKFFSLDFVKSPATNVGLFDEPETQPPELMADEKEKIAKLEASHVEAIAALNTTHTAALSALKETHVAALAAKDGQITALGADLSKEKTKVGELEAKVKVVEGQRDDAQKYDIRLAGAPALQAQLAAKGSDTGALPEPAATVNERWGQYTALCEEQKVGDRVVGHKETNKAEAFRKKYLDAAKGSR